MKALLLADPPAGDKVQRELEALGVKVDYRRGAGDKAIMAAVNRPGNEWVIAMNAHSLGAAVKAAARANGAHFVSIPPGWSGAQVVLQREGFFTAAVEAARVASTNGATALKHRPFEKLMPEVAAATEPPRMRPLDPVRVIEAEAPAKVEAPPPPDDPKCKGCGHGTGEGCGCPPVQALVEARRIFETNPEVPGREAIRMLRTLGIPVPNGASNDIYRIRREVRAARGLEPSSWEHVRRPARPAPAAAVPVLPGTIPYLEPGTAADVLPDAVLAGLELVAQELRKANLEGEVTVTHTGDVAYDVVRRLGVKGRAKVDAVGAAR